MKKHPLIEKVEAQPATKFRYNGDFRVSLQINTSADEHGFYEEFRGTKSAALAQLKKYLKQATTAIADGTGYLIYVDASVYVEAGYTKELGTLKIDSRLS